MRVLIAGAGIGGLSAALALHQQGIEVQLFEQATELGEVGAGLQIGPNGTHVLEALGLGEQLAQIAFEPQSLVMRMGRSGNKIFTIPLGASATRKYGARYYHVHRSDLHNMLANALRMRAGDVITTGVSAENFTQTDQSVVLNLSNNTHSQGDVLIGADGIHSRIRAGLFGPDKPKFTGCVAWRLTVPTTDLPDNLVPPVATVWCGQGRHVVTYYVKGGDMVNVVAVVEQNEWQTESWMSKADRQDLISAFEGWHPIVEKLLHAGDPESCFRWALFDRDPMPQWGQGRVSLLGDACHPMLPFLAQGAVMAIEDGWCLGQCLAQCLADPGLTAPNVDPAQALREYQHQRQARTAKVQLASRANAKTFHRANPAGQFLEYGPMWLAGKFMAGFVNSRLDWIYGTNVTRMATGRLP